MNANICHFFLMQAALADAEFAARVRNDLASGKNVLARSNQGTLLKLSLGGQDLLVKCPMGKGLALRARQKTLVREYEAYQRLEGLSGVPRCYGLIDGEFLAIELIRGVPFRDARFEDRESWFADLLEVIRGIHRRGVSHGDLKSKSNILVTEDQKPCVIDFGTAFVHKTGFHPFNNWMFRFGERLDLNAWVKHKYHGRYEDAQGEDGEILRYTWLEKLVRRLRGGEKIG